MLSANLEKEIHSNWTGQDVIFTALVDPAIIYDSNMNVIKVNNAFIHHYGTNLQGLNVRDVISMFSCKWLDESRYVMEDQPTLKALKGEYVSGLIFSIKFLGEEHIIESSSGPIYENGTIKGALTVWHSIDKNHTIQQAYIKSEEVHRHSNDFSPFGVLINKNGLIVYANNTALKMLGAKHLLDIENKKIEEFIHPEYLSPVFQRIANLKAGKIFEESEIKLITLEGKIIDTEVKAVNISTVNEVLFKVFLRDITSQKKLDNYNNVINAIAQEILSSYSILDITQKAMETAGESISCDSAAVSFFKEDWEIKHTYKFHDDIEGLRIPLEEEPHALLALNKRKILFIEDTKTDTRVNNERLQKWGIQSVIVVPLYTKYDKIGVIFFNFYKRKIYNHEEIYFLMRFSTILSLALENSALFDSLQSELNIKKETEKKLLELNHTLIENTNMLKELNATKDKFFSIIAHDLRNPFTNLIGASELLAAPTNYNSETSQRLGKVINEAARKGYNLLQNLLDWSRSQTGTISFKPELVVLQKVVKESWSNVKASAFSKNLEFDIFIDNNIQLMADVNMLSTILRNLLQNAVKFTPEYGRISISAIENNNCIVIIVEDSGVGMSEQDIEKLFRIDVKFSNPGTSKESGTGIGLLLCKEFVEKHKGKIWVTSTEGKGSKFYFSIPIES